MSSVVHRIGPASCHTGHHLISESLIVHKEQWVRSPINAICILAWCQLGSHLACFEIHCVRLPPPPPKRYLLAHMIYTVPEKKPGFSLGERSAESYPRRSCFFRSPGVLISLTSWNLSLVFCNKHFSDLAPLGKYLFPLLFSESY